MKASLKRWVLRACLNDGRVPYVDDFALTGFDRGYTNEPAVSDMLTCAYVSTDICLTLPKCYCCVFANVLSCLLRFFALWVSPTVSMFKVS